MMKLKNTKKLKSIQVNLANSRPESWNRDNSTERKLKQIMKLNSQLTKRWKMNLKKISIKKWL